jgi:tRNA threonylcarbamoyladenosine biosynthesis protein TsaB
LRVLAVDTTTANGSVALAEGGEVRGEVRFRAPDGHSAHVLPAVEFLLRTLSLTAAALDGYAVATGPGSFTGLRVGLSTIQGLALGAGRPCVGVPALDVLAARIAGEAETLVAMIDAYRDEVYAAVYDREGQLRGDRMVLAPELLMDRLPEAPAVIGDGALRHRERILSARPKAVLSTRGLFLAGTLARIATLRLSSGQGGPPDDLRPLYLREADVRRPAGRS